MAGFYREFMDALHALGSRPKVWPMPVEVPNPIRFDQDVTHSRYDPEYAHRFWRLLVTLDTIFKEFRARFIGKVQPGAFFLGELRPGGDAVFGTASAGAPGR